MRSADKSTILRIGIILFVLFLIAIKFNAAVSIILFALAFALDGVDGYLALKEASKGKVSLGMYISYSLGNKKYAKRIKAFKEGIGKTAKYGPRFDVAADRIAEYAFWATFTAFGIVPLFVFIIVIIRHSIADALLAAKGTSSKMKSSIAKALYGSSASRALANVLKFVTFSYLILVYVSNYPILPGYVLIVLLVSFIVARGAAEIYEASKS